MSVSSLSHSWSIVPWTSLSECSSKNFKSQQSIKPGTGSFWTQSPVWQHRSCALALLELLTSVRLHVKTDREPVNKIFPGPSFKESRVNSRIYIFDKLSEWLGWTSRFAKHRPSTGPSPEIRPPSRHQPWQSTAFLSLIYSITHNQGWH